jgi:hypothetical protein
MVVPEQDEPLSIALTSAVRAWFYTYAENDSRERHALWWVDGSGCDGRGCTTLTADCGDDEAAIQRDIVAQLRATLADLHVRTARVSDLIAALETKP